MFISFFAFKLYVIYNWLHLYFTQCSIGSTNLYFLLFVGHLLSTAQVESALIKHPSVAEAAVVGKPHPVKGECMYCFVTLREGHAFTPEMILQLKDQGDE